jgi:cephalosporin hydroxylase
MNKKEKRRIRNLELVRDGLVDVFNKFYYNSWDSTWGNTFYLGIETYKYPTDLWIYQEIIYKTKPDVILEIGTYKGGSTLYLADICNAVGRGLVIGVDNFGYKQKLDSRVKKHKRILFIEGSSVVKKTILEIKKHIKKTDKVLVILDSDHSKKHVLKELEIYSKLVTKKSYLILEDTNINGHPVYPNFGPGPMEALEVFMKGEKRFVSDRKMEKFFVTVSPKGYLLRIK